MPREQAARAVLGGKSARHRNVRTRVGLPLARHVPIDEHERACSAVADGGLGDRRDDRNETVGGVEEPADVEPAIARVEEPRSRRGVFLIVAVGRLECRRPEQAGDASDDA